MQGIIPSSFTAVVVVCAVLPEVGELNAQDRRVGRSGVPASFLLADESIQEELKLSTEQARNARDVVEKDRRTTEGIDSTSGEEGDKRWRELLTESEKAVTEILNPAQLKRFKQLRLQQAGAQALADPQLAAELKLTEDLRKAVKAIAEDRAAKVRAVVEDRASSAGDRREAYRTHQGRRCGSPETSDGGPESEMGGNDRETVPLADALSDCSTEPAAEAVRDRYPGSASTSLPAAAAA